MKKKKAQYFSIFFNEICELRNNKFKFHYFKLIPFLQ